MPKPQQTWTMTLQSAVHEPHARISWRFTVKPIKRTSYKTQLGPVVPTSLYTRCKKMSANITSLIHLKPAMMASEAKRSINSKGDSTCPWRLGTNTIISTPSPSVVQRTWERQMSQFSLSSGKAWQSYLFKLQRTPEVSDIHKALFTIKGQDWV